MKVDDMLERCAMNVTSGCVNKRKNLFGESRILEKTMLSDVLMRHTHTFK